MPSTTLLLNGFSIIGDPHTNTAAAGGGRLLIHGGEAVFDGDDIVAFTVSNADANGILTDASEVTGIIVYDNASDYYNGVPKYTYDYTGAGAGAEIDDNRAGMGDTYLEFDASGLTSTDAGAPVLDQLAMVSGVDILTTLANSNGPMKIATFQDIDLDGNGTIDPGEGGDGQFSSQLNDLIAICFARGTLIETPEGPRFIETLRAGDLVTTLDHGPQPIRWIGGRKVSGLGKNTPIRIRAGALGNVRDLWVSPNHRMLVRGAQAELLFGQSEVLVAAKHLVNDKTIRPDPCAEIEYFHFLFDAHQIVFAEACASESLYPGQQTLVTTPKATRAEILALFPELEAPGLPHPMSRYALSATEARALRHSA
ncbi:Hint domain-containing protein [Thalassococcus sp. BH17M4-6]|uniref:Hint domain-containing protein n=1 Tax=Thalassococcus sp. BH17M4-6 TaxID=3413148 RepID=UPI003BE09B5B